jgi:hypothetical protein
LNRQTIRQAINVLSVIITITINGLANALPLNNQTTGEISNRFQVYFVPAGYVFSIWGLIYLGLIFFAVYQALPSQRNNPRLDRISYLFALSCLANITWLFLWHYEQFVLTLVAMFSLLGLLIAIYLVLGIGKVEVSKIEKWCIEVPFSLYLGWVTVAAIANVTITLSYLKWNGWGLTAESWAFVMLLVSAIITFFVFITRNDITYVLVIIWAFVGISVKQIGIPMVEITAWILAGLLALLSVFGVFRIYRLCK